MREEMLGGERVVGVFHRGRGNFFRFPPVQWTLLQLFDGVRTYDEVADLFSQQTSLTVAVEEVRTLAESLEESDFWYRSAQERTFALNDVLNAPRNRLSRRPTKNALAQISFSVIDPDGFLTWLDGKIGSFLYSSGFTLLALLLFFVEAFIFVTRWDFFAPDLVLFYTFTSKSFAELAQFWLLFFVIGFFHEMAHGLTCKHFGGQVHKMGFLLLYLTPAFFVDITEIWLCSSRRHRSYAIIAGIWIELIFCGSSMIVWLNTQPGQWGHNFCYEVILMTGVAAIVLNLNPLAKFDGYYLMTEWIGIPDLKERSTAFLSGWVQRGLLGLDAELPVVARGHVPFFVAYAFLSGLYSYVLLSTVVRLTYNIGSHWLGEFALIPAVLLAYKVFHSRLAALRGVLKRVWSKHVSTGRMTPALTASLLILLALVLLPIRRDRESGLFVIEPEHSSVLHAPEEGTVSAVFVDEGEEVRMGEPLLQVRSVTVDSLRSSATAQSDAARFATFNAQLSHSSLGSAASGRDAALRSEALAGRTQASLLVRAPADGVILTRDPAALTDRSVGSGEPLLTVAEYGSRVARIFIPAAALNRIQPNAEVALIEPGQFGVLHARLPALEGDAVALPPGLATNTGLKGVAAPTYYYARIRLDDPTGRLELGMSGDVILFGARRSLFARAWNVGSNLFCAHVW
ncbi:peptidase, M50 family [Granulicella sibirica]|uniref:Peptidase, M50 family n=1 Tax=Granulicella sibirica TaxID=2479048 RepID=A0A4Q0SXC0_9BACT|nr:peptidase, M50 family [Granulicella sibirica]